MANSTEFNQLGPNQWPALAELRTTDAPDFLAGLNSTVAIEFDVASAGTTVGAHAGPRPNYQPIPGFDAVPCRLVLKKSSPTEGEGRPGVITTGRALFGHEVPADRRNRLVYEDPTYGTTYLYLQGRVRDAHQMGHHWVVDVQDRAL